MNVANPSLVNVDSIGSAQPPESLESVRLASEKKVAARANALVEGLHDPAGMRAAAATIRQLALDDLDACLIEAERQLESNGIHVHWAEDGAEACRLIVELCRAAGATLISKSKSMVTEEIELNHHLEQAGFTPVETDLGEYVVQLDRDRPSHIVTPIIHMNQQRISALFEREGLGDYTEDPEQLTAQARARLRQVFERADVGITGANFVVAESGRIVTVSNEGNLRFTANAPRIHVAITGIEKVVAKDEHLKVLLNLLARSATGQDLTVYTQFLASPRGPSEPDGPDAVHLIFLDNGRSRILEGDYREMLRCIRCGACLNVCPVYRNVTGHGYRSVYPGPMGAILSPLLGTDAERRQFAHLPKASSLCAACEEVCPVAIPIPRMLLSLRAEFEDSAPPPVGTPPFAPWKHLSVHPMIWRAALWMLRVVGWGPARLVPVPALRGWLQARVLPKIPDNSFRRSWRKRDRRERA